MKALSQTVQKLWPMLKLSNQQTNKQTGQNQYVPAIAIEDIIITTKAMIVLLYMIGWKLWQKHL